MNYKAESLNRLAFPLKFGDRPCRIYGTDCAEYLLLQMTDEHELQNMDSEVEAIALSSAYSLWMEFEQQHPIQAQRIYLSLGDKEEHTKNAVMAVVGDNIRTLHSRLAEHSTDCMLEWNSGGHFKDADLRTARAFRWVMEDMR